MNQRRIQWWVGLALVAMSGGVVAGCETTAYQATPSPVCSSGTTLTVSPAHSVALGGTATFTMTPACSMGDTPEWRLFYYAPGASGWALLNDWTTSPTFNWDTSFGVGLGQYQFEAHIRAAGAVDGGNGDGGAGYETFADLAGGYTVGPAAGCSSVSANISGSGTAGTPVTITANGVCTNSGPICGNGLVAGCPEYRYWIRPFGGAWRILQDWSDNTTATFIGDDSAVHTGGPFGNNHDYRIEVDVRNYGNGNPSYDNWTEVDWDYTAAGTCPTGTSACNISWCVDTQTNSANCGACQGPGPSYAGLCSSSSPVCTAGSCGTGGTCATISGSASPSPATVGNTVVLTGNASCSGGSTPLYQFWMQAPGAGWTLVRPYNSQATFSWDTTGLAPGTYRFEIDTKASSSSGTYEGWTEVDVTLMAGMWCSSVSATTSASAAGGTPVTISASAVCGGATPEYRYWTQDPGGSWALLQDWSTSATASFIGTSASGYRLEVDARAQGNGNASYDSWTEPSAYYYTSAGSCPSGYSGCQATLCSCGASCSPLNTCGGGTPTCGGGVCI